VVDNAGDNAAELIIQLPRGSSVDVHVREEPPVALTDGRVVLEHLTAGADGKLPPPAAGEIVLTVPSPEALRREPDEILNVVTDAAEDGDPLIVLVEGAEYLRDDEIDAVLEAAAATKRVLIMRIIQGLN
jgi:hypothetical protein